VFITAFALSCLLAAVFLFSGARKATSGEAVAQEAAHLGVPVVGYRAIGVAEIAGAGALLLGLAWAPLGIVAAAGFVLLMLGAVAAHLRVCDPAARWAPAAVIAALAAVELVFRIVSS
jgi:hypothetical protein